MSSALTRNAIVDAARALFAERGYHSVTIKEVGSKAGYSPAMVMKVMGSKAELYAAAAPNEGALTSAVGEAADTAAEGTGFALVRRLVDRRTLAEPEPWAVMPLRVLEAPDAEAVRRETRSRAVAWVTERIGDTSENSLTAELVVTLLLGLASSLRVLRILDPDQVPPEELISRYGRMVQDLVDGVR